MSAFVGHGRIIGALVLREMVTRYGRRGFGFLWVIGEPLIFCLGVLTLWTVIKPEYEHGVRVAPFIMTGYMCLLLLRHVVSYSVNAVQANVGLLYHRNISILHIYGSRVILEFSGASVAFLIVYIILFFMGSVGLPNDPVLLYSGWMLLLWLSTGMALTFSGLAMEFEVMERIVPVLMYLMIPISGAFIMASWLPGKWRDLFLLIPLPHTVEMVRGGVFGEFVPTYYHPLYVVAWSAGLTLFGLLLLARARKRLEVE